MAVVLVETSMGREDFICSTRESCLCLHCFGTMLRRQRCKVAEDWWTCGVNVKALIGRPRTCRLTAWLRSCGGVWARLAQKEGENVGAC